MNISKELVRIAREITAGQRVGVFSYRIMSDINELPKKVSNAILDIYHNVEKLDSSIATMSSQDIRAFLQYVDNCVAWANTLERSVGYGLNEGRGIKTLTDFSGTLKAYYRALMDYFKRS